jgi:hypothetical protein
VCGLDSHGSRCDRGAGIMNIVMTPLVPRKTGNLLKRGKNTLHFEEQFKKL